MDWLKGILVAVVGVEPEAAGYEKATENTVAFLLGQFSESIRALDKRTTQVRASSLGRADK